MTWWDKIFGRPGESDERELQQEARQALEEARNLHYEAQAAKEALWAAVRHAEKAVVEPPRKQPGGR